MKGEDLKRVLSIVAYSCSRAVEFPAIEIRPAKKTGGKDRPWLKKKKGRR